MGQFAAARSDQTSQPDDFAGPNVQGDVVHTGCSDVRDAESVLRPWEWRSFGWENGAQGSSEHAFDKRGFRFLVARGRPDDFAVSQYGHRVTEVKHLRQEMGDEQDGATGFRQRTHHVVKPFRVLPGERSGWLIHDDQRGSTGQGAQYLDLLLIGRSQGSRDGVGTEVEPGLSGQDVELRTQGTPPDESHPSRLGTE